MPCGSVWDTPSRWPASPGSGGANSEADPPEPGHGCGSNGRGEENSPCGCSIRWVSDISSCGTGAPYGCGGGCAPGCCAPRCCAPGCCAPGCWGPGGSWPEGGRLAGGWLPGGGGHGMRVSAVGGGADPNCGGDGAPGYGVPGGCVPGGWGPGIPCDGAVTGCGPAMVTGTASPQLEQKRVPGSTEYPHAGHHSLPIPAISSRLTPLVPVRQANGITGRGGSSHETVQKK